MSKKRVSTADYTIPSIRSTNKATTRTKLSQKFPYLQQQPPSQNSEGSAAAVDDEYRERHEKKSDAQPSSKNLSKSQSISKIPENSTSIKKKHPLKIFAAKTSKVQVKTAEPIKRPPPPPQQQKQKELPKPPQNLNANLQSQPPPSQQLPQNPNPNPQQQQNQQEQQQQLPTDPTQISGPIQAPTAAPQKQKPKNSVSSPAPISPSSRKSINTNNTINKSGSYIKVDSGYKRATTLTSPKTKSRSRASTKDLASLDTAISEGSLKPTSQSTKTCIEWDEKKIVTKVNLNSKKAPQIFCFNIRWILLLWGLLLCCYDSTMLMTNIFNNVVFLEHTYHYIFILTFPSGPALFYLMISEKVSIVCWKTHISCQIFRVILNIYLFLDYYCAWLDSLDSLKPYQLVTIDYGGYQETKWIQKTPDPDIEGHIRTYFAVFLSLLGVVTVLSIIMFGFAINLYYYEKEALKRRREKWRRRINKLLESHQTFVPPETEELSSDIASSTKFSHVSKK